MIHAWVLSASTSMLRKSPQYTGDRAAAIAPPRLVRGARGRDGVL